jgi:hypothetical protein
VLYRGAERHITEAIEAAGDVRVDCEQRGVSPERGGVAARIRGWIPVPE